MPPASSSGSVLITGANGFIGSRLCQAFAAAEFRVFAAVRASAKLDLLKDIAVEYRHCDITSAESLGEAMREVDHVILNAGIVKAKDPRLFYEVNAEGTRKALAAIATVNPSVKRVVYVSSLAAAGPSLQGRPVREDDAPHPITEYGKSKLAGERVCAEFTDRLPISIVRPPGVYGPGEKEIFSLFQAANRRILPSFGDPIRRIQLVHVDDLCRGVVAAAKGVVASGSIYFIAEKSSYRMMELVRLLFQASGKSGITIPVPTPLFKGIARISTAAFRLVGATRMFTPEKANELLASWEVSTEKARTELGFESEIPFGIGALQTFRWYREKGWLS